MVDVDRRNAGQIPTQTAALRRLSTRAAATTPSSTSSTPRIGLHSFSPLANSILSHLNSSGVSILPGLSPSELSRIESHFSFQFPPDLSALLSLGLPSGPNFPNWRSISRLQSSFQLPIATVSLQSHTTRSSLRRAPILIPLFNHCYIPSRPSLAGNPVFYVDEIRIACCGFDLSDFFLSPPELQLRRQRSASDAVKSCIPPQPAPPHATRRSLDSIAGKIPRWIEFWTDAASNQSRRISSDSDVESYVEIRQPRVPEWVGTYLDRIGSVLREGGWDESDVREIVHVSVSGGVVDSEGVLDRLVVKVERCSDSMRKAGWREEEVFDVMGFDYLRKERRRTVMLPPEIAFKVEKLAQAVSRC